MEPDEFRPYYRIMTRIKTLPIRAISAYQTLQRDERGASMVEYVFLVALIAMVAFLAVAFAGTALDNRYDTISQSVSNA